MKYISLDIETTGLNKNENQIVEVGAVLDDIGSTTPIEKLPKFRAVLLHGEMLMGSYCAKLHRDLWAEIQRLFKSGGADQIPEDLYLLASVHDEGIKHVESHCLGTTNKVYTQDDPWTYYCYPGMFEVLFSNWLCRVLPLPSDASKIKINVAGKNPGSFDIPFLEALPGWKGLIDFRRRVLDPASHCIQPDDEHIPDLQECLKRCGLEGTVDHTAVKDAIDIIRVIRQRRIGEPIQKAICCTCTVPVCPNRSGSIFNCSCHTTLSAEESSCDMCDNAACGYRSGRRPERPCHRFNPK